jgi:hypothetical protein
MLLLSLMFLLFDTDASQACSSCSQQDGEFFNFLQVQSLVSSKQSSSQGAPPTEILGRCEALCVLEKGSGYPCPYTPTYPVWFYLNNSFNWRAPYQNSSTVEVGNGRILTEVKIRRESNGSWQAHWFAGNHLFAPTSLQNVSHCACYYAKGNGVGKSWHLSNYGVATIPNSSHLPVDEVCKPHVLKCPDSNSSAFEIWGPPWIEDYSGCNFSDYTR